MYTLAITATSGTLTHTDTAALIITQSGRTTGVNFGAGFSGAGLQFNGHTVLNETALQLTDTTAVDEASRCVLDDTGKRADFSIFLRSSCSIPTRTDLRSRFRMQVRRHLVHTAGGWVTASTLH